MVAATQNPEPMLFGGRETKGRNQSFDIICDSLNHPERGWATFQGKLKKALKRGKIKATQILRESAPKGGGRREEKESKKQNYGQ